MAIEASHFFGQGRSHAERTVRPGRAEVRSPLIDAKPWNDAPESGNLAASMVEFRELAIVPCGHQADRWTQAGLQAGPQN
jgi:hypothetical protein